MYLDTLGFIVQSSGDGGDTLQREGFWYEGVHLNPGYVPISNMTSYLDALVMLDTNAGFERYWKAPYDDPSDTSRDQLVSNVRACGYYGYTKYLKAIFWPCMKNFSRYPNGDVAF